MSPEVHGTCPRCHRANCTLSVRGTVLIVEILFLVLIHGRALDQITLHQGAIEAIFLDSMKVHGAEVERPRQPSGIEISEDVDELSSPSSYPVKVSTNRPLNLSFPNNDYYRLL